MNLDEEVKSELNGKDAPVSILVLHSAAMTKEAARMVLEAGELMHLRLYAWSPKMNLKTRVKAGKTDGASATLIVTNAGIEAFKATSALIGEEAKNAIRVQAAASYSSLDILVEGGDGDAEIAVVFV